MRTYESSGKSYEEALQAGLEALGVALNDVEVTTLQEGSKGLFGLFGSRDFKLRLTVKETEEDLLDLLKDKPAPKPEKKPAEPKPERKPAPKAEKPVKAEKPAEPAKAEKAEKTEKPAEPAKQEQAEAAEGETPVRERKPRTRKPRAEKPEKTEKTDKPEKKPLPPKAPVKPIEKPVLTELTEEQITPDSAAGKARDFLRELTGLMGVNVEMTVSTDAEGNVFVAMTGDTLGILIGRHGETLDALQYLTSLKVNRGQEGYTRVTLDTENYRAKREDTLIRLANRMANKAVKTGRKVSLEPMNPYERRIIHSSLQANENVDTHSEGEEPNRHIVITLRK